MFDDDDLDVLDAPSPLAGMSGAQKCAILMMLLDEDEAATLLQDMSPREVQGVGAAMLSVADVGKHVIDAVLDEFLDVSRAQNGLGPRSEGPAVRTMLVKALGESKAGSVMNRIAPPSDRRGMEILEWMDARSIAGIVAGEHAQVIAVVLSHLGEDLAADVLRLLPNDLQPDVIQRVATLDAVPPEAIAEIEHVLQRQLTAAPASAPVASGGVRSAAKILSASRGGLDKRIIATLLAADQALGQSIKDEMFVFENLLELGDKDLQTLLRSVESDILVVALKGADETMKARVFGSMSSRAAAGIQDEIDAKGPMRVSEVQEAQKAILAIAAQLGESGVINLGGGGEDFV